MCQRPRWLADAHEALDRAVAYGWPEDISSEDALWGSEGEDAPSSIRLPTPASICSIGQRLPPLPPVFFHEPSWVCT